MSSELFDRYKDLQAYVGWSDEDAARIKSVAQLIEGQAHLLIDDFYEEIERHPATQRVITGGQSQITRLKGSLRAWLSETLKGPGNSHYVDRRWRIGLQHAEVGLHPAYTRAAMARLRNRLIGILADNYSGSVSEFCQLAQSFNKLLDLDLAIVQDAYHAEYLTREKVAEHERSEIKFRMLVEAAACMVVILRDKDTIAYFSPYSAELTGYLESEVVGRNFVPLFIPERAQADVYREIAATLTGQPTKAYETPLRRRDGIQRWIVWNAQRLDDFEGSSAVLAVGQDFTEQREAQERLLRSERLAGIGQMITGIAHESRNALQRIQSCSEMLELEIAGNDEALRLVRRLQEAQDNLLRLFDEVRGFVAPICLERSSCHIENVWREAWELLNTSRRGRDATLLEQIDGCNCKFTLDRFRMVQVFRNLLENSLAACRDPVVIRISCRDVELNGQPAVEISVRDNGPGLTPDARQNVFEPFFTTKTKGTGLGMAIARRIVEAHGGQIAVGNDSSVGAEFIITMMSSTP
jgi:two-component system, LuxR family, sensor kinase FixL